MAKLCSEDTLRTFNFSRSLMPASEVSKARVPLGQSPGEALPEHCYLNYPVRWQTVLLVEEDDDLREVLTIFLEDEGYVVIATKATAAVHKLFSDVLIDILICESSKRSGTEAGLVDALTRLRPSLPVVIVLKHLSSADRWWETLRNEWTLLVKPFKLPALSREIAALRSRQEPSSR